MFAFLPQMIYNTLINIIGFVRLRVGTLCRAGIWINERGNLLWKS